MKIVCHKERKIRYSWKSLVWFYLTSEINHFNPEESISVKCAKSYFQIPLTPTIRSTCFPSLPIILDHAGAPQDATLGTKWDLLPFVSPASRRMHVQKVEIPWWFSLLWWESQPKIPFRLKKGMQRLDVVNEKFHHLKSSGKSQKEQWRKAVSGGPLHAIVTTFL